MSKSDAKLPKGVRYTKNGYEARKVVNGVKVYLRNKDLDVLLKEFEVAVEQASVGCEFCGTKTTLNKFFDFWFDNTKRIELKESSIPTMRRKFNRTFGFYIGGREINKIRPMDIQAAVNAMVEENMGQSTILDAFGLLRQCLDAAIANRLIVTNPCLGVVVPKQYKEVEEEVYLSKEEEQQFLSIVNGTWYQQLFQFMFATGVRVGEAGGLMWEDIDFNKKFITIRHNLSCSYVDGEKFEKILVPKTKYSVRQLPFKIGNVDLEAILIQQKEKTDRLRKELGRRWRAEEDVVFTTTMGSKCTRYIVGKEINKLVQENNAMEDVKVRLPKFHPHSIRHTFATRCAEAGVDVKVAQKILGHSSVTITLQVYQHVSDIRRLSELEKLGKLEGSPSE